MTEKRVKFDDRQQSKAFIEMARKLGADCESGADELMASLRKMPPAPRKKKVAKKR